MKKLNIHNLKAKEIKKLHTWLRTLIQILYFLFLPSVYTAAFAGVKYIFTQIGASEAIGMTSFVTVLIVLCAYTILFGRFFCGFACAFGSLGDGIHAFYLWCFKKRKKKAGAAFRKDRGEVKLSEISGIDRDCSTLFCGSIRKGKRDKPVGCFFYVACRKFPLAGIFAGSDTTNFYHCRNVPGRKIFLSESVSDGSCILIASGASVLRIAPRQRKLHQRLQRMHEEMPIRDRTSRRRLDQSRGDCFQCQKCIDTCPKKHIHTGIKGLKGNEFWFTILRAILLLVIMIWAGV